MASKKNKKMKRIYFIFGIFCIILLAIILKKSVSKDKQENQIDRDIQIQESENRENDRTIEKLKNMKERDRMEFYCGVFLDYIENEKYEKAYDLLYPEFKNNYFPTLNDFIKYAQNKFSDMLNIEHDNIERNGEVYVMWLYIIDAINGKPGEKEEMKIVIKENDYNDFVLSFSVNN